MGTVETIGKILKNHIDRIRSTKNNLISFNNIEGFDGFIRESIILIGARRKMGVTNFMLSMASCLVQKGEKVLFISRCISIQELLNRFISMTFGHDIYSTDIVILDKIKGSEDQKFIDNLLISNLRFDESNTIEQLKDEIIQHKIRTIFFDDFQLLTKKNDLSYLTSELLKICEQQSVTFFIGVRLGKSVDKNSDKSPQYKDFLQFEGLLDTSSQIIGLYRPAYYGYSEDEDGHTTEGTARLISLKNPFAQTNAIHNIEQTPNFYLSWNPTLHK